MNCFSPLTLTGPCKAAAHSQGKLLQRLTYKQLGHNQNLWLTP